jgi:hypothetical protein
VPSYLVESYLSNSAAAHKDECRRDGNGREAAVALIVAGRSGYDSSDPNCTAQHISAGHGFVEPANHIHLAASMK